MQPFLSSFFQCQSHLFVKFDTNSKRIWTLTPFHNFFSKAIIYESEHTQHCGSSLVSMQIRIQLFVWMRIRIWIRGANPTRIYADPEPGQTLKSESRFLGRNPEKSLWIFPPCYSQSPLQLFLEIPGFYFFKFTQPLTWGSTKLYVHEFDFRIRIRIPNTGPDPGQPNQCR